MAKSSRTKAIQRQFTTDSMGHFLLIVRACEAQRLTLSIDSFLYRGKTWWTAYIFGVGEEPIAKGRAGTCGEALTEVYKAFFTKNKTG